MFSDSEASDAQSFHQLTINEHYAKAFEYKKEREELQKLKDKYGSDVDDSEVSESDSESDETEDEDGDELTPAVDAAILRTLARIKRKDPSIYDATTNIFGEEHGKVAPATKRTAKAKDKVLAWTPPIDRDAAVIPTYPRNLPSLVRREDSTRKDARERRKQRKAEELQKKREEVKRLKSLKMKEIRARLERVGREGGKSLENDQALQDLDLDADWDPAAHDRQMAELYHDGDDVDHEKPQWDEDIDIGDIVVDDEEPTKQKKKKKKKKAKGEDDDAGVDVADMDADVEAMNVDDEEWDGTEEMRKRVLDKYMDELYGLDFNDLVGGLPTRFKYTPVQSDNFALTPAEILMATDQELNEYMGIRKFAPYRQAMKWDSTRNERLKELKSKIVDRTGSGFEGSSLQSGDRPVKKRKGKKERMKMKAAGLDEEEKQSIDVVPPPIKRKVDADEGDGGEDNNKTKKKRRRKQKDQVEAP
ncbi:hypothetical protein C0993_006730 [Termitomyces sp. T159_Od127]|nr:hypothetical protein C0993_006730 [Termitomyces sp. T159_Od127]